MTLARKYSYRRTLPHLQKDDRPVFVTFPTLNRRQLPEEARGCVLRSCLEEHGRTMTLHAGVVMPDLVHLILTANRKSDGWNFSLPEILQAVKSRAARAVNVTLHRSGPVWQQESFDHVLRSNESLGEKIDYVYMNPVRAGLVRDWREYPWLWRGEVPVI